MIVDQLKDIFATIEIVNIAISYVVNAILLWAVLRKSQGLGSYKYILLAFTINNIFFPFIHALTLPIICSYNDAFFMFSNGILTSKFSICLFAASHSQAMPIIAHLFIYRLVAVKWPHRLRFYTAFNTTITLLVCVAGQKIIWFCDCWYGYGSDSELRAIAQPFIDTEFPGHETGLIGALYYNEQGLRLRSLVATMGLNSIMTFWISLIAICGVMTVRAFRKTGTNWSCKTEHLQRQLFRTLIVQMIVPFLCVYLPCAGQINLPIFVRVRLFPNPVSAALTFFPVIDAIITLFGVRNYRNYLLSFFKTPALGRRVQPSIHKVNST